MTASAEESWARGHEATAKAEIVRVWVPVLVRLQLIVFCRHAERMENVR